MAQIMCLFLDIVGHDGLSLQHVTVWTGSHNVPGQFNARWCGVSTQLHMSHLTCASSQHTGSKRESNRENGENVSQFLIQGQVISYIEINATAMQIQTETLQILLVLQEVLGMYLDHHRSKMSPEQHISRDLKQTWAMQTLDKYSAWNHNVKNPNFLLIQTLKNLQTPLFLHL